MSLMTTSLQRFDGVCDRLDSVVERNAGAIVLACLLSAALVVWLVPAPPETRCMLVKSRALSVQAMVSLAIAATALAWQFHKPVLRFAASLRRKESDTPSE
jgi:hypothetical protein